MKKKINSSKDVSILNLVLSLIGVALLGFIIVAISIFGVSQKENESIRLQQYSLEANEVHFELISNGDDFYLNSPKKLAVYLDTSDQEVQGVDLKIGYSAEDVELLEESIIYGEAFDTMRFVSDSNGVMHFIGHFGNKLNKTFSGKSKILEFEIMPISQKNSNLEIVCMNGKTNDSNIMNRADDLINCGSNLNLNINKIDDSGIERVDENLVIYQNDMNIDLRLPENMYMIGEEGCNKTPPRRPTGLTATTTGVDGQVRLNWNEVNGVVTHYSITYGKTWIEGHGPNESGNPNVGNVTSYLVNSLEPGKVYYFVVAAVNDCISSGVSDGAAAYAGQVEENNEEKNEGETTKGGVDWSEEINDNENIGDTSPIDDDLDETDENKEDYEDENEEDYEQRYKDSEYSDDETKYEDQDPGIEEKEENFNKIIPILGLVILGVLGLVFVILTKMAKKQEM